MSGPLLVRLHDDVRLGPTVVRRGRVLRLSGAAQAMLVTREVVVRSEIEAALADRLLDLDIAHLVVSSSDRVPLTDLTVVVPVRDRCAGVDRLLGALASDVRCVVVDDASVDPDALARVVARHGSRLVRLEVNEGPAAARNAGLRLVETPFVAFVDSDVVVTVESLSALLAAMLDPQVAAVAPRVRTRGGRRWFERYEDAHGSLDLGPASTTARLRSLVSYVPSACLVARVATLGEGFDPSMRSGEDVDLVWRLLARGHRVRHVADVHAWHDGRTSIRRWLGRKVFYGTSAAALAERHGADVAPAVLGWSSSALLVASVAQRRWSAPLVAALLARHLRRTSRRLPDLGPWESAAVVARATAATAQQGSSLALRHWWPLTLVAASRSRRLRRAVAVAVVVDAVVTRRRSGTALGTVRFGVARRLDDVAYGAGVWWGAARGRSMRCLVPAWVGRRVS